MISPRTSAIALTLGVIILATLACEDEASPPQFDDDERRQAIEAEHDEVKELAGQRSEEIKAPVDAARRTVEEATDEAIGAAD